MQQFNVSEVKRKFSLPQKQTKQTSPTKNIQFLPKFLDQNINFPNQQNCSKRNGIKINKKKLPSDFFNAELDYQKNKQKMQNKAKISDFRNIKISSQRDVNQFVFNTSRQSNNHQLCESQYLVDRTSTFGFIQNDKCNSSRNDYKIKRNSYTRADDRDLKQFELKQGDKILGLAENIKKKQKKNDLLQDKSKNFCQANSIFKIKRLKKLFCPEEVVEMQKILKRKAEMNEFLEVVEKEGIQNMKPRYENITFCNGFWLPPIKKNKALQNNILI